MKSSLFRAQKMPSNDDLEKAAQEAINRSLGASPEDDATAKLREAVVKAQKQIDMAGKNFEIEKLQTQLNDAHAALGEILAICKGAGAEQLSFSERVQRIRGVCESLLALDAKQ